MRKPILIALLLLAIAVPGLEAQEKLMTLEECVNYALANSVSAQNAMLDQEIAKAKVKETIGIGLPQVSGSASLTHNPELSRFFTTYDTTSFFSAGLAGVPGIQIGDVAAAENFFQLKSAGDANVMINQLIFNGSYIVGLQTASIYKSFAEKSRLQTEEEIKVNVSKAFYAVLINKERLNLFTTNIARIDSLLNDTQAMYENGFAEKIDVSRLKVTLNNLKVEKENFEKLDELAIALLKFQMNYPYEDGLALAGEISDDLISLTEETLLSAQYDYSLRPDYQVLEVNRELQKMNIRNIYAESVPSIGAFAKLGYSTQSPTFGGLLKTEATWDEVEGAGPDKWYNYSMIGLSLNWSLFTGLQRNFRLQQQKLELQKIENSFDMLESSINMERTQSITNLKNAQNSLMSQSENMELAEEVFSVTQTKFQEGVGSNLEVIEAESSLKEAQTNYYEALYNAIIAKIDLLKAIGTLDKFFEQP
ncbi:MAG: TolC family protein [Cyclobacteriaceae bacterium]